ncbi:pilus assembly protein TadG-related protein [Nakamurella multipartita]|uniref:Putative Flp pilus-assembly TadG-like N-terminal domain-containing protein n=1 Tax=Nakamurella multipartita (strain ATCC 700099 / DSM 44233 / CIP 104796 / JCM 9543 / NBRC 105858 / Y-104) TaxID=479431 RepID=C8X8P7_NAKMY|nr:pilus assembly protein TadG-related protein [Nakamurella multipartita]ACV79102.1 hypothetical protein Namu_2756 [Nakamurella multipartita DSM 44233]
MRKVDTPLDAAGADDADDADRGSVTAWLLGTVVALLVLAGLVLDGGTALAARGRAADSAAQAARAGADALDQSSLRSTSPSGFTANPAQARAAANRVLAAAGVSGEVQISGAQVTVTARATDRTAVLTLIGIDEVGGEASATAIPLHGMTTGAP